MRSLFLKDKWAALGAKFSQICGRECVEYVADQAEEGRALRSAACLCDMSFSDKFFFAESDGMDFLDTVLAGNILKLRYGRLADSFLARPDGSFAAECFVADIDDKLILLAEDICSDGFVQSTLSSGNCGFKDISADYVLLCLDGPLAQKIVAELFGADIFNLPYLSVEKYAFDGHDTYLFRNGKTGDFGYQFLVPNAVASEFFDKLSGIVVSFGGGFCGTATQFISRLEGGFFNAYAEGMKVANPLELGLQWQIDFSKDSFCGSDEIFKQRTLDSLRRLVCLKAQSGSPAFKLGEKIFVDIMQVGEVVSCGYSHALSENLALAIFDKNYAFSDFDFSRELPGESNGLCTSISRPCVLAKSLSEASK